jgi:hypothetical protein
VRGLFFPVFPNQRDNGYGETERKGRAARTYLRNCNPARMREMRIHQQDSANNRCQDNKLFQSVLRSIRPSQDLSGTVGFVTSCGGL